MLDRLRNELALLFKSAVFTARLKRDLWTSKGKIVLVYQVAKVGSSSVYDSVQNSLEIPVYHTHFLDVQ